MLELLQLSGTEIVLEVGTGSGYVTALLSQLAAKVFSIERHADLASISGETLARLGYANVQVFTGDGSLGLPSVAPFDAILVSAAAPNVPPALLSQLRESGRMVIPVGSSEAQELQFIRMINGQPQITRREPVRFVPLISGGE
jgi:protein-L-isoaspartate(D-aspartate) O-methyltransferase